MPDLPAQAVPAPSARTVLVTRPAEQASAWVRRLADGGVQAAALPLIGIAPPTDLAAVDAAWDTLAEQALVVFVSPSAVAQFFARRPPAAGWPATTVAASPGPGTGVALQRAGVPQQAIVQPPSASPQFDSEALWQVLRDRLPWPGAAVLIVRGDGSGDGTAEAGIETDRPGVPQPAALAGSGREWLSQTLTAAGARVTAVVAYRRGLPEWQPREVALARRAVGDPDGHLWLFSSSEAIGHLVRLRGADGTVLQAAGWHAAQALATHPRIAARARAAGFGRVLECAPTVDAVRAAALALGGGPGGSRRTPSIESGAT